jgi:hypothetical protein
VIERADLIVFAPAAPVRKLLRGFSDGCLADYYVHAAVPFAFFVITFGRASVVPQLP